MSGLPNIYLNNIDLGPPASLAKSNLQLPLQPSQHIMALQDTVDMQYVHPYSQKTCTIKCTQVPIIPMFAMRVHKLQGQTMDQAIIDLQSCHRTESLYMMLSKSLS